MMASGRVNCARLTENDRGKAYRKVSGADDNSALKPVVK